MIAVAVDPDRLTLYRSAGERFDQELRALASSLDAAADRASVDLIDATDAPSAMQVAAARDVVQRIDALGRAAMRTTRWVGAVGAAFAAADDGALAPAAVAALIDGASAPGPVAFVAALARLRAANADPAAITALVGSVPSSWLTWAARGRPELVGPVDGMPVTQRYASNQVLLRRMLIAATEPAQRAILRSLAADDPATGRPRQFLLVDPSGDGRVVEVFGDLATAEAVGVLVPGADTDLRTYERRLARQAGDLHRRTVTDGDVGSSAVVAWLGTDTPDGLSANPTAILEMATATLARGAGHRLHRFIDGLGLRTDQRVVLVGHSYGSTMVGAALLDGVRADDVVVAGSPGVLVDRAADFGRPDTWFGQRPRRPGPRQNIKVT